MKPCKHDRLDNDIDWDKDPSLGGDFDGAIAWYGKCECGKRVYELDVMQEEVFEVKEDKT
jgi:hypothetical protein